MSKDHNANGPHDPHPLSKLKTQLVWEGKYDEFGNRRRVEAAELAMPLQRIETVDEPRSRAESQGKLFDATKSHLDDFRNMLVWGDNKLVMASLLKDFRGKVDLIYIDPPFDVGADFTMEVPIGGGKEMIKKDQSVLEMVAYRDTWGKGTDSYLHMMYDRLALMKELLSDTGSIYVHCDWHVGHFLRCLLDELFDRERLNNEIVWWYTNKLPTGGDIFDRQHDRLLWYSAGSKHTYSQQPLSIPEEKQQYQARTKKIGGRREYVRDAKGSIVYEMREKKAVADVWEIPLVHPIGNERLGYSTQKPEALLERIIDSSSNEGDLIADLFCGSGTTGAVAERLGRRWIMCDLGRFSIHTSRKRLIEMQRKLHAADKPYRAFGVYNLGRYERQWWQKERLKGADDEHRRVVLEFYRAEPISSPPSPLIHGRKGVALCHVDSIDSVLDRQEMGAVAAAASEAGAKELACLAWEFEMDLRLEANRLEKEHGLKIRLIQIPREIMEKNRREPPPFLEVATLEAEPVFHLKNGVRTVDIKLTRFIPSLAEAPTRELKAMQERARKSGFDFIDFWAVDFDFTNGDPFNHHWQDYRTRKDRSLKTVSDQGFVYPQKGQYTACVKVVDVFGADTSVTIQIAYE